MEALQLHQQISTSLATTKSDQALADALLAQVNGGDARRAMEALEKLRGLESTIYYRERGHSVAVPDDPELAAPVLKGMGELADIVRRQITDQAEELRGERGTWLAAAIAAAFIGVVSALVLVLVGAITSVDVDPLSALAASVVVNAAALSVAVFAFRVYQSRDETYRRLREKLVALDFLDATLVLSLKSPQFSPLIERSFGMFVQHYESSQPPINAKDLGGSIEKGA